MIRGGCSGVVPLTGRLEPWQREICERPDLLAESIAEYGSPLNVLDTRPFARNVATLQSAAAASGIDDLAVYFARKANKALAFVDEAARLGLGVDVASENELRQALDRLPAERIVVTAAVKQRALLELCVATGVTVVVDNEDELDLLIQVNSRMGQRTPVAFRLAPQLPGRRPSRFGLDQTQILATVSRHWRVPSSSALELVGVHFHLDGYAVADRIAALDESLELIDALRLLGHRPTFIDIGGGVPMSYLDDAGEWERFWHEHRAAVIGDREPMTFEGHGLGLLAHNRDLLGSPNVYPYYQRVTGSTWIRQILETTASGITSRGLDLRCQPGRMLLDGCGVTVARVEYRKQQRDGTWLIGLAMNRTQCRSSSDDHLVDPLLIRSETAPRPRPSAALEGYLVGAYCIERELLSWRRLRFPLGVQIGDLVVFPNTAGYLMHILESASHQIPLARNVLIQRTGQIELDPIDAFPNVAQTPSARGRGAVSS